MLYLPSHFEVTDPLLLRGLVADFPLGTLITLASDGLTANHIPFVLEPARDDAPERLIGHVARQNAVWHDHDPEHGALVVFQSIESYITPNWYETKRTTHEVVPTWNYAVVHVAGPLVIHDDVKWIRGQAGKLTRQMESHQPDPWKMADAPRDYTEAQLLQIVGIEIPIQTITGKFKASQNRPDADAQGAATGLRERGGDVDSAMASLIDRMRPNR